MLKIFVNSYFHTHKNLCEQLETAWKRKIARLHIQYKTISDMCVYAEPSQRHQFAHFTSLYIFTLSYSDYKLVAIEQVK